MQGRSQLEIKEKECSRVDLNLNLKKLSDLGLISTYTLRKRVQWGMSQLELKEKEFSRVDHNLNLKKKSSVGYTT